MASTSSISAFSSSAVGTSPVTIGRTPIPERAMTIQTLTDEQTRVRRGDPRLRPARVRHPRAARRAHRPRARAPQPGALRADRRARLARGRDPRGVRRRRRRRGRHVPAVRGVRARADPDGLLPGDDDHRAARSSGSGPRSSSRRSSAGRRRHGRGDRDVRARGRLRRRQPLVPGRARQRRLRDQRAEDLDHRRPRRRPHPARLPHHARPTTSTTG